MTQQPQQLYQQAVQLRHRLHQHPELAFQERETTRLIQEELERCGAQIIPLPGVDTGVVALIQGAHPGPVLALREDIDALPMGEETGLPFASQVPGCSHACGHDIHTAALVQCAWMLCALREELHGSVLLIFQCAEEIGKGAIKMLEAGALKPYPAQAVAGFHCDPNLPLGTIGVRYGKSNASFDIISITVTGRGGHGAQPQQCVDPVLTAAYLITQLQTVVSRENRPTQPAVLTIGEIHGGTAPNIIPDTVKLRGSLRTLDHQVRSQLLQAIERITRDGCRTLRAKGEFFHDHGTPPIINDRGMADQVARAAEECLGRERLRVISEPAMSSDDFACWTEACGGRGVQFLVGTRDPQVPNTGLGLHAAENIFPDQALEYAAPVMTRLALNYLSPPARQAEQP